MRVSSSFIVVHKKGLQDDAMVRPKPLWGTGKPFGL